MRRTAASLIVIALLATPAFAGRAAAPPTDGHIVIDTHKVLQTIRADEAFGGALDGAGKDEIDGQYSPHNIQAMLSAGLGPVSYRLRTELGVEAWHWNEAGTWSDPAHQQGYWTSSDKPGAPIAMTHGYELPRRGDTLDNANENSWSRLDDGDEAAFWKTNPYLDKTFTHLPDNHPQWAITDLGTSRPVDTLKVAWGTPYAVAYRLQYWVGGEFDPKSKWVDFPGGAVTTGRGGTTVLRTPQPIMARFIRLKLEEGSNTAPAGSTDIRDRLGFAVREWYIGRTGPDGVFTDYLKHVPDRTRQTWTLVSSSDPWHRAIDRDDDLEQPGIDLLYTSGITRGLPMMIPVGAVYDTPDNAAALIRYIKARGYPIRGVELGEEPDGQLMSGIDYADLYIQAADAVHRVDPKLKLGGPSLQDAVADAFMEDEADKSFTSQFIKRLEARGRIGDLNFFSFERYPFDNMCAPMGEMLVKQTAGMTTILDRLHRDGVPAKADWTITEYGFSAFSGQPMVELPGALLNADVVGQFLSSGGKAAFMFGYTPSTPMNQHLACAGFGDMMLHEADADGEAKWPMPIYWGARLLTQQWVLPGHGVHTIYGATSTVPGKQVTAYAVHRPDGKWALMIINRDGAHPHTVTLRAPMRGRVDVWQYSPAQYAWHADGAQGYPSKDEPPVHSTAAAKGVFTLPAFSLTVVQGTSR
jgi:hypothetical protein